MHPIQFPISNFKYLWLALSDLNVISTTEKKTVFDKKASMCPPHALW